MKKTILIILLIYSLGSSSLVFASEDASEDTLALTASKMKEDFGPGRNFFNEIFQKLDQEVIDPVKQTISRLPQDIENGFKHLWEKFRGKKQEKQEEIKEEIKQEIKEEVQESGEKAKIKYLAPLKNKIQQGSSWLRELFIRLKNFVVGLF